MDIESLTHSRSEAMRLDFGDVGGLGVILAHALLGLPGVPLGLAFHIEHAWALRVDITHRALLVKRVKLKLVIVRQGTHLFGDILRGHSLRSLFKSQGHLSN